MDWDKIFLIHVFWASQDMWQFSLLLVHTVNANPQIFLRSLVTLFSVLCQFHPFHSLCSSMIVEKIRVHLCTNHIIKNISQLSSFSYYGARRVSQLIFQF